MEMTTDLVRARSLVQRAGRIVVLTGAGVSAESGVPTFRGAGGLWRNFRPEELATPEAFARDPELVWEWYRWRRELVQNCEPNAAHHALATLALSRDGVRIVTQNVDGLHARAAVARATALGARVDAAFPLELHGSILRSRCTRCETRLGDDTQARCARCGARLRPDVVWFGEMLDPDVIGEAQRLARNADLCLVVGTSAIVYPAAGLASLARAVIEVNPDVTPLTSTADISLRGTAGAVVPQLI